MNSILRTTTQHYGFNFVSLVQQQGGWAALAYRITTDKGQDYFLKVYEKSRASTARLTQLLESYLPVIEWLDEYTALKNKMIRACKTVNGNYRCEDDQFVYVLFEYLSGITIGEAALSTIQVKQLAEIIAELHKYGESIPVPTAQLKENFQLDFADNLLRLLDAYDLKSDLRDALAIIGVPLREHVLRLKTIAFRIKNLQLNYVWCHTDIHPWNLMSCGGVLNLIDWEGLKLAPVEADLFGLLDAPYFDEFFSIYKEHHPNYIVQKEGMEFYVLRRKLEDIWEFAEQLQFEKMDLKKRREIFDHLNREFLGI